MRSIFIACAFAAMSTVTQAQLGRPGSETARRLSDAVTARQNEETSTASQGAARAALVNTAEQARAELAQPVAPAQAALESAGQQRMAQALSGISPEGKALLAQNQAPLLSVPAAGSASPQPAAAPAPDNNPKPKPLKPEPLAEPVAPDTKQTVITGDLTYFDSANSIAVFVGNVVVDSPQFHITCDEFEVHMRKDAKDAGAPGAGKPPADGKSAPASKAGATGTAKAGDTKGAKGAKSAPPAPKPDIKTLGLTAPATAPGSVNNKDVKPVFSADNPADTSIESAIGKGRKVVIVKHNPDGKIQIGQSRYAYYDGNTGDITLRQSPQVQDGNDLHIALEPTTVMIMTQAGALHTTGRARTDLVQADQNGQSGSGGKGASQAAPAPGTGPALAPAPAKTSTGGLSIPGPVPGQ